MRHKQQVKFAPLPPPFKNFGNDNDSFAIFYLHWGNFSSKMWKVEKQTAQIVGGNQMLIILWSQNTQINNNNCRHVDKVNIKSQKVIIVMRAQNVREKFALSGSGNIEIFMGKVLLWL